MIKILEKVVLDVAEYQRQAFHNASLVFETKADPFDLVSEVDRRSQQMLLTAVEHHFPASGVVAEEEGQDKPSQDGTWFLIDPLDGTANFKAGIPLWAISIGFVKNGTITSGLIALPPSREIFRSDDDSSPILQPLSNPLTTLSSAKFYGIDSTFESLHFKGITLKRRQLGAAVPTLLWCCDSRYRHHPRLDFALMGKGSFWDVCGAISLLKHKGGALIDVTGQDFTECTDVFQALGGLEKIRSYNFSYVASASKSIAQEVYLNYLKQQ